jgi:hypothetical protein
MRRPLVALTILFLVGAGLWAQPGPQSQEVSDDDGIPVLIKHLPEWQAVRAHTVFARSVAELRSELGERPVLELIDFSAGTEAVTAPYAAGRLLIVEYSTPQGSSEADGLFQEAVAGDRSVLYRRIGNYNAFVFDVSDHAAAGALLDQIQYEKEVQWLGDNPFIVDPERAFVLTITDIFISTVLWIVIGIGVALTGGILAGWLYFRRTNRRRAALSTFTDAGGMTRLNLDGFTPENRLLND